MATYNITVTTGAVMEKGLDLELTRENARRAALTPPGTPLADKAALVQFKASLMTQGYAEEYKRTVRELVGTGVDSATAQQLNQIATLLGITLP